MQQIITYTLYLLAILIPLTFTTINSELFEFPKFILLISGTLTILVAWLAHIYQTKKLPSFPPSTVSYTLLAFLSSQIIATIFSISPFTSFWGYYSRFHQGLATTLCYTIIYFAGIKWLNKETTHKLIKISVGTSFIVCLYAILEHFGIDKSLWVQDVQSRVFSTLGQPNWLAAYIIPNIFLTLYLSQSHKKNSYLLYAVGCTLLIALLFTKSRSGILAFVISYAIFWIIEIKNVGFPQLKKLLLGSAVCCMLLALVIGTPFFGPKTNIMNVGPAMETGGTESGDIRKIVWSGAFDLIKKYPLLGTGPETFAYTYYWVRPLTHNLTSEWDFLYNKAHNEYLNIAAGSGLLGLLAYLSWHLSIFILGLSQKDYSPVLAAGIVAFAITNFFGFSVIPVYLMMVILSIIPTTIQKEPTPVPRISTHNYWTTIFIIILTLIIPLRFFLADLSYARGKALLDASHPTEALPLLEQALRYRNVDLFHASLGEVYGQLAASSKGVKYEDQTLREITILKNLNPYHLNYFKSRAKIYLTLATYKPAFHVQAATELEEARVLAPTDPKIAYNLGLVYAKLGQSQKSYEQMQDAIRLRPIYQEAYYATILLLEESKQVQNIPPLLEQLQDNLATYSSQLKTKIDKYLK